MPSTRRSGRHCAIAQIALARFRHPPARRLRAAQLARAGRLSYHAVRRRLDARTNTRYAHTPHVCAVPGASRLPRAPCRSCDATATAAHTRRANPRHPAPARRRSRHAGYYPVVPPPQSPTPLPPYTAPSRPEPPAPPPPFPLSPAGTHLHPTLPARGQSKTDSGLLPPPCAAPGLLRSPTRRRCIRATSCSNLRGAERCLPKHRRPQHYRRGRSVPRLLTPALSSPPPALVLPLSHDPPPPPASRPITLAIPRHAR
jgi:hypothetical protein